MLRHQGTKTRTDKISFLRYEKLNTKKGVWIMKMLHHAYGKGVASSWGMPEYKRWFEITKKGQTNIMLHTTII